jgi:polysaccharide export outer membrane protein
VLWSVVAIADDVGYALNAGDVLQVSVWKETELTREVLVRPDGKISFPLVGDIMAAGTTPEHVQAALAERLQKYIPDPVVTVSLGAANGNKVYVLGKVARPGEYIMARPLDVMQALAMAGGLNTFASENKVLILRAMRAASSRRFRFRYAAVQNGENCSRTSC